MLICFRREKYLPSPLFTQVIAPVFSWYTVVDYWCTPSSPKTFQNHTMAFEAFKSVLYSTSVKLSATFFCKLRVACMQNPLYSFRNPVRLLSLRSSSKAQLISTYAVSCPFVLSRSTIFWSSVSLTYFPTRFLANICFLSVPQHWNRAYLRRQKTLALFLWPNRWGCLRFDDNVNVPVRSPVLIPLFLLMTLLDL